MKKLDKRPVPGAAHLKLEDDRLRMTRGGQDSLGKVVMDSNILPT